VTQVLLQAAKAGPGMMTAQNVSTVLHAIYTKALYIGIDWPILPTHSICFIESDGIDGKRRG
jgi:hypothetical protein